MAVDLQRRCGSHGDALAGTLGVPHAEILIEPFRDEPEIDTLKRRFERDLDLSVLDLQLDQLQPNRALAYGYKAQRAQADANAGSLQEAGTRLAMRPASSRASCDGTIHPQDDAPEACQTAIYGLSASRRLGQAPGWRVWCRACRTTRRHRCAAARPNALHA